VRVVKFKVQVVVDMLTVVYNLLTSDVQYAGVHILEA